MRSLYDRDDKDMLVCDKIIKCANITIKRGMNLPEQICNKCYNDLEIAYRFRTNCESADAILQSFIDGNVVTDLIMSSENGEVYKYKPPQGLNVKRIRPLPVKLEPSSDGEDQHIDNIIVENGFLDGECNEQEEYIEEMKDDREDAIEKLIIENYEMDDKNICTMRPVKTNKARSKAAANKNKLKVVHAQAITTKPDGTTIIRYRKNVEEQKPLKICEICGNTYKYKHALESHMRRHRNEKPFSCEICGRAFVINFELRRHMRTHTGQKPYACRFCGRKFSDFGSRIKHERTHTGERPYTCETCGKSFAYSHVLSSHILTHTGEKRFACSMCGKRFTKSHHLKAHLNTHMKNSNKHANFLQATATTTTKEILEPTETQIIYETAPDDKVYGEVLAALNDQQKIEEFVDEEDVKVLISEEEHRHAIDSINIHT
ncbi:unnamed protein product [Hermetia illucens]|uniref:Uncharacterized protein n=2 Tax=Hermetia illucens TaxID=343691 RepID=A0A7R8V6B7_HERIL|nr:unnamed protein product [Hermetia illucens]